MVISANPPYPSQVLSQHVTFVADALAENAVFATQLLLDLTSSINCIVGLLNLDLKKESHIVFHGTSLERFCSILV